MATKLKNSVPLPFWILCILAAITGLGWLIASVLFGRIDPTTVRTVVSIVGIEISKAVFIGSTVGIGVNLYLKRVSGDSTETILRRAGIKDVFPTRIEMNEKLGALVNNPNIKRIDLMGISLRDYLKYGGICRNTWNLIVERLQKEESQKIEAEQRLKVRVLLLHPFSSEGRFRYKLEKQTLGDKDSLANDVPSGRDEINRTYKDLYDESTNSYLELRLYDHCPFSFLVQTERDAFIEQYYYRDHTKQDDCLPIIQYSGDSPQYRQLGYSFEKIWAHASKTFDETYVGHASAIEKAKIENIFHKGHRETKLSPRQLEIIKNAAPSSRVRILAISGKFYTNHPTFEELKNISCGDRKCEIEFALMDPVSHLAIHRAVADSSKSDDIKKTLKNWSWKLHKNSNLYRDINSSLEEIKEFSGQHNFTVRLYFCGASGSSLITNDHIITEQYFFGRSQEYIQGRVLGGEFPAFEYRRNPVDASVEEQIITSTFDVIWNQFSISLDFHETRNLQETFESNLTRVKEDLEIV